MTSTSRPGFTGAAPPVLGESLYNAFVRSAQAAHPVVQTGRFRGTGIPVKMGRTPGSPGSEPPAFGAHSAEVLAEAGYSEAEIAALMDSGVVPRERKALR